ncbi:MAG: hypothetical protein DRQ99_18180, partial [Candidatus Parabeggiatoa sp. nov. 3]
NNMHSNGRKNNMHSNGRKNNMHSNGRKINFALQKQQNKFCILIGIKYNFSRKSFAKLYFCVKKIS